MARSGFVATEHLTRELRCLNNPDHLASGEPSLDLPILNDYSVSSAAVRPAGPKWGLVFALMTLELGLVLPLNARTR